MTTEERLTKLTELLNAVGTLRRFVRSRGEGRAWSPAEVTSWLQALDNLHRHIELWVIEEHEKENG